MQSRLPISCHNLVKSEQDIKFFLTGKKRKHLDENKQHDSNVRGSYNLAYSKLSIKDIFDAPKKLIHENKSQLSLQEQINLIAISLCGKAKKFVNHLKNLGISTSMIKHWLSGEIAQHWDDYVLNQQQSIQDILLNKIIVNSQRGINKLHVKKMLMQYYPENYADQITNKNNSFIMQKNAITFSKLINEASMLSKENKKINVLAEQLKITRCKLKGILGKFGIINKILKSMFAGDFNEPWKNVLLLNDIQIESPIAYQNINNKTGAKTETEYEMTLLITGMLQNFSEYKLAKKYSHYKKSVARKKLCKDDGSFNQIIQDNMPEETKLSDVLIKLTNNKQQSYQKNSNSFFQPQELFIPEENPVNNDCDLVRNYKKGDFLYGIAAERLVYLNIIEEKYKVTYSIIDDFNDTILDSKIKYSKKSSLNTLYSNWKVSEYKQDDSLSIQSDHFFNWALKTDHEKLKKTSSSNKTGVDYYIGRLCKVGIAYAASINATIHFCLDNFNFELALIYPVNCNEKAKIYHAYSSMELRRIYRDRYKLNNIMFYVNGKQCESPWLDKRYKYFFEQYDKRREEKNSLSQLFQCHNLRKFA